MNDCGDFQEAENFPEIRLNLNGDGEPEEIMFYNPLTGFAGKELLGESPGKGRHALALLILFTAKERKRMLTRTSEISLPSSMREFTSTLAEEVTNPNRTKKKHWLVGLFGENPRGVFLEAARLKDDTVYFPDDVIVTVSNYLDGECSIADLEESFDRYSNDERKRAKKIEICVEVERSVERKGYLIRAGDRSGSITFGDQVRVKVAPNYSTSLAVFWVSSDGSVSEFFPNPEKALKIPKPVVQRQKLGSLIEIPEELFLNIDTDPGTETCIVVAGTRRFDRKECKDLKKEFQKAMPNWLTNNTLDRPRKHVIKRPYLGIQIGKSADPSAMDEARIAKPKSLEEWEKQLLGQMPDKVTSIRFLHLPNI